ncbi:MAG: DUF1080 domain-containing protein [Bacteroidota bacterium]|nr:DUF1080 domain-containing protein [Bacteroidota bacterium]
MKKLSILCLLMVAMLQLSAQHDPISKTLSAFPYQQASDASAALAEMHDWKNGQWSQLFTLLDDDSLKLSATYALSAYVQNAAMNAGWKKKAAQILVKGLEQTHTYYSNELIMKYLGLLGEDVAVKSLSKYLNREEDCSNAARALAAIHSDKSIAALKKALSGASESEKKHIQAALDNASMVLPQIISHTTSKDQETNPVQHLLHLEDAYAKLPSPTQKMRVLAEAESIGGFPVFMFVSKSLDDPQVNPFAARICARMSLKDPTIRGTAVRDVLEKSLPLIKGEDSALLAGKLKTHLKAMPYDNGFVSLFNGKDLSGWKALVGNPISRSKMTPQALADAQEKANEKTKNDWIVKDGLLIFTGHGDNLCTDKPYGDFEMYVDWKITEKGDAGIYLRGSPQVQIWDTSRREVGAEVGSGGLYNNQKNMSKPLVVADNKIGEWNQFHIIMKGDKVTVYLNGQLVTDNIVLENYWDRSIPIFPKEQIELQAHGTYVAYRNIYLREIPETYLTPLSAEEKSQGYTPLFDGSNMDQWIGNTQGYLLEDGAIVVHPEKSAGNLYTKNEYADFSYRFEFQLTPGANNGIGIRAPLEGDAAYVGMEIQVLDNEAEMYKNLHPYQYHGSVYGVIPAKRGYLKPVGQWNQEEIIAKGTSIKVILNGTVIVDGDIKEASQNGTMDHKEHPGLLRTTGHIGFLGHGDVVRFKNIRIKEL